ncbi:MAG: hypothetical protein A2817_01775 [Candidatus Yanofskybacteria bacterium RIFCSPHIGHO2_01_FULL_39_8b]|uniref:Uncharacterized protein n=1 Tax=Candidatus Yanofskybacteria bacterium RIFCSPHIGHO2_01_FULL_39_8b TaxID=1802659 RepID=A0A1F8EB02_9BACT|nr:MAG: hypothetical protein A2817_01775 [Candidatus Yanofskybacteria bacterium RIFCSPHIGHO2_01_FULL_39_8b]
MESRILETYPEGIYRKTEDGEMILGQALSVFIHNGDYHLVDLKVFQDGKIDCWDLIDFEEFKKKIASGWVQTSIPDGSQVSVFSLGRFKIKDSSMYIKETELIKEVKDIIDELNGKKTTSEICRGVFEEYNQSPTEENKQKLKTAYEDIPEHNRCYVLGDMNEKDYPIRYVIYGKDVSYYQ